MLKRFVDMFMGQSAPATVQSGVRLPLATCVVLLEAASVDESFTAEERRHIMEVLSARFELSAEEAGELLEEAAEVSNESVGLHRFTRAINEGFSPAEKEAVIEEVWRVFYSDGALTGHEDHLAHELAKLLNLSHPQLIDAKMKILKEVRQGS